MFSLANEYEVSYRLAEMERGHRRAAQESAVRRALAGDGAGQRIALFGRGRRFRGLRVAVSVKWAAPPEAGCPQSGASSFGA